MLGQSDLIDKMQVGFSDIRRLLSGKDPDQQSGDAFGDNCIAVSCKIQKAILHIGMKPHPRLTSLNQIFFGLMCFIHPFQTRSQLDQISIFIHPIIIYRKFIYNFLFFFLDCHFYQFLSYPLQKYKYQANLNILATRCNPSQNRSISSEVLYIPIEALTIPVTP